MRTRSLPLLLLGSLITVPALADDVYLVNGRKFEGVIAETTDTQVRIRMQGGTLSLPREQVLRVDQGDSNLAEYLRRKDLLKKDPTTRAADWLLLSHWAHGRELDQAARESALAAATLDPKLEGLSPVLRSYGYVLDPQLDRWIPYADSMRRQGYVQMNGQWVSREEHAALVQQQEEEAARSYALRQEAASAAREDRMAALQELSIVSQIVQQQQPASPYPYSGYDAPFYGYGGYSGYGGMVGSGFGGGGRGMGGHGMGGHGMGGHHGGGGHHGNGGHGLPPPPNFTHIPGSLIPGNLIPKTH
jgi:hypothetical protein